MRPGANGTSSAIGSMSTGASRRTASTTASFSSGAKVQVEYSTVPPVRVRSIARRSRSSCIRVM